MEINEHLPKLTTATATATSTATADQRRNVEKDCMSKLALHLEQTHSKLNTFPGK